MANIGLGAKVLAGHLLALEQMDADLLDLIEEIGLTEPYLAEDAHRLGDVRGALRLSYRELNDCQFGLLKMAEARAAVEPGDVLTTPTIIDQPVSPARLPQENP